MIDHFVSNTRSCKNHVIMPLQFDLSHKSNQQLVGKGFVYTTDKLENDKHIWKCVQYVNITDLRLR